MSLNWDLSKIKNHDALCWLPAGPRESDGDRKMNPVTNALIWNAMSIGMGTITEANYLEAFGRSQLISKLVSAPLTMVKNGKRVSIDFTVEDFKAHIGLSTNVFPMETRKKFAARIADTFISGEVRRAELDRK